MKKRGQDALVLSAPEYLNCQLYLACGTILVSHLKPITTNQIQFFLLKVFKSFFTKDVLFKFYRNKNNA